MLPPGTPRSPTHLLLKNLNTFLARWTASIFLGRATSIKTCWSSVPATAPLKGIVRMLLHVPYT